MEAQSGSGLVCGRSPLPTLAHSSGVLSQVMSRASIGAASQQQPHRFRAARVGGGVQRGAAVISATGVEGKAEVEHQAYRLGVAALGGEFDRAAFVLAQPVHQLRILRDQLPRACLVPTQARGQEMLGGGGVVASAVAAQHRGQVGATLADRHSVGGAAVRARFVRVGAAGEQEVQQFRVTSELDRRVRRRAGRCGPVTGAEQLQPASAGWGWRRRRGACAPP